MSHHLDSDEALDAALGQLGSPEGASPVASPAEILARAAPVGLPVSAVRPVTASGPLAGARARFRGGLAGGRLVAAVLVAVGAGFGGGMLTQRGLQGAGGEASVASMGVADGSETVEGRTAAGPSVVGALAPEAAVEGPPGTQVSSERLTPDRASARGSVPVRRLRTGSAQHSARASRVAEALSGPVPAPADEERATRELGVPPLQTNAPDMTDLDAPEGLVAALPPPPRADAPSVAEVDVPGAEGHPFVLTAGVGAALSRLPPRLDAEDAMHAGEQETEARVGPFATLGATWRGTGAPRVGYAGLVLEAGRLYGEGHALASVGFGAVAGLSWERPRVRFDLGGTAGARTVWGRHAREALQQRDEGEPDVAGAPVDGGLEPEEGVRGSRLSIGPTLGVALGRSDTARWTVQVAPQVALARAAPPSPWLQLTLGCELPVGGDGG